MNQIFSRLAMAEHISVADLPRSYLCSMNVHADRGRDASSGVNRSGRDSHF